MQVLYALPFLALGGIAFVVCLLIPSLRRHAIAAAVGPVAFGFWSIAGVGAALVIGDAAGYGDQGLPGLLGAVYVLCGVVGACLSVWLARGILGRLLS